MGLTLNGHSDVASSLTPQYNYYFHLFLDISQLATLFIARSVADYHFVFFMLQAGVNFCHLLHETIQSGDLLEDGRGLLPC